MTSGLLVKERDIVVPGEIIASGMDYLPAQGAFRDQDNIIASQLGLVSLSGRLIKIIPLSGKYVPRRGDVVIGKVINMSFNFWYVDIGCANDAVLPLQGTSQFIEKGSDLSQYYTFGDVVIAKVNNVTRGVVDITMKGPGLRKVTTGKLIKVTPSKVPRIIGKQGSMISLIKDKTGCKIIVGQNGVVWIQGEPEMEFLVVKTLKLVEERSHLDGLTDEVTKFLENELKEKKDGKEKK